MSKRPPRDYDVGFGRPPVHTRFKKGKSGNPRGRPKGSKNLRAVLTELLMKPTKVRDGNRVKWIPFIAAVFQILLNKAANGDAKIFMTMVNLAMHLDDANASESPPPTRPKDEMPVQEKVKIMLDQIHERMRGHVEDPYPPH